MKKSLINYTKRKALDIKYSGRSSDYITPSYIWGCLYKCVYCYMRRNKPVGISIAENYKEINDKVLTHINKLPDVKISNQTHDRYYTYDIGCNTDVALHWKYMKNMGVFDLFINNKKAFGTFATKHVNKELLKIESQGKIRIRYSLMPEELATLLEPNTSPIIDRIKSINDFYNAGYDVHVNYSPIIVNENTGKLYAELFKLLDKYVHNDIKEHVKAECIFLTHNNKLHEYNIDNNIPGEELLWQPDKQEEKVSTYGSVNLRYNWQDKNKYTKHFLKLIEKYIPWQEVRYIF